jgi:hypothetical protein
MTIDWEMKLMCLNCNHVINKSVRRLKELLQQYFFPQQSTLVWLIKIGDPDLCMNDSLSFGPHITPVNSLNFTIDEATRKRE